MYDAWNKLKTRIVDLKGLTSIGIADIAGNGLNSDFLVLYDFSDES